MDIKNFHKSRIMFAELPSKVITLTTKNELGHKEWLKQKYNIDSNMFEKIPRGYADTESIYFYMGSDFSELPSKTLARLMNSLDFLTNNRNVYNGMIMGNIGEKWQGKTLIRSIK